MEFEFIDLFAGIGGFHAALSPLGGKCVFVSEIDLNAKNIYTLNWAPDSINSDIREATEGDRLKVPEHDVLTAGFPCQPFSKSGHQRGVNEARGTLFFNILKIIEKRKPKLVLLENVKNLVGPKHLSDYKKMIKLLRELGYAVSETPSIMSPHLLPLKHGGSPQSRERIFIGAFYVGKAKAKKLTNLPPLFKKNPFSLEPSDYWEISKYIKSNDKFSAEALRKLKITKQQNDALKAWDEFLELFRKHNNQQLSGLPLWTDYWGKYGTNSIPRDTPQWKMNFITRNKDFYFENRKWIDPWIKGVSLREMIPSYRKFEWQAKELNSVFECLVQFRPSGIRVKEPTYVPAFVAMTQTPVVGWLRRELSVSEAKILQGFPARFDFSDQPDRASMKQIGNAVHPAVAKFAFKQLVKQAKENGQLWAKKFEFESTYK